MSPSWGAGAKALEDGWEFCLLPHTQGHFPAMGNKNYHFRTMPQLIWKTIKNAQGYGVGEEEIVSER